MDSDAVLLQPTLIGEMLQHIKGDDVYGVGRVVFFKNALSVFTIRYD